MELNRSEIEQNYEKLIKELADPEVVSDWERFEDLSKKKSQLDKIRGKIQSLDEFEKQVAENEAILKAGEDRELNVLADEELRMLAEKKKSLENEIEILLGELTAKAVSGPNSVIIEIRAAHSTSQFKITRCPVRNLNCPTRAGNRRGEIRINFSTALGRNR